MSALREARFVTGTVMDFCSEAAMGGKRPDQHSIDPAESGATDYKWGEGHEDRGVIEEQKQKLQSNPHDQPMIPSKGVNPALRELQEKKRGKSEPAEGQG